MRPDEQANQAEIERDERFRSNLKRGIGTSASIAAGAAASRVMPFLSEYVPVDLALKGLSKVSPHIADFLKRGQKAGLDIKEGMNYVKDLMKPEENKQAPVPNKKNLIEMHSPELHQFIEQEMKKGQNHLQAGARATLKKEFGDVIEKLKKEHKTSWEQILEAVYGGSKSASQNAPQATQNAPAQPQEKVVPQQAPQNSPNVAAQAQFIQELKNLLNA